MKKPNWVCSTCSMWSSRKSSVKRHIQNVHGGNSNLVSFIDYMAGREWGFYFPGPRPTYGKNRQHCHNYGDCYGYIQR